jgi:hypothetical protein
MWLDGVDNGRRLVEVFGNDAVPSIESVYLMEVKLQEDGPQLQLRFDLKTFPSQPPADWVAKKANMVQVTLMLGQLRLVEIHGFGRENHVRMTLQNEGGVFRLGVVGTATKIRAEAGMAVIPKVSPYLRDPPLRMAP